MAVDLTQITNSAYSNSGFKFTSSSPGSIISAALPYVYIFAGLALLVMLIWGGITLMTAAGDPAKSKDGYGKITAGLIGFGIIFAAYFVVQILEVLLSVKIF